MAGKISDKFGRKPIICFGVLTSLTGLLLSALGGCSGDVTAYDPCDPGSDGAPCDGGDVALFFIAAILNVSSFSFSFFLPSSSFLSPFLSFLY